MKWNDDLIEEELLKSINILMLDRMPTAAELKSIGRNDLHCKISRTKKYSGWADYLGLSMSKCETRFGIMYESLISADIEVKTGLESEQMTTKHPYDLLVNNVVKVDVKVANLYKHKDGIEWWTFHLAKEKPTCDIYICVALNGTKEEKTLIIPSHLVQMKSLNIGKVSKYDKYNNAYHIIKTYANFFNSIS